MTIRSAWLFLLLVPAAAFARDWQVDPAGSSLTFKGSYQGEGFDGRFKRFDAKIRYDEADLANAKFDVEVDLASADTDNTERDETLLGSDFFATSQFPKAHFVTQSFEKTANGTVAHGTLTLRDQTRPVTLAVTFAASGDEATLDVHTTIKRADFGIGAGDDWADVGTDVPVSAHLVLRAQP